jgi:succinate dehydrogenase / fumarate reductase iron-sulfur subunit
MLACSRPIADQDVWGQLERQERNQPAPNQGTRSLPSTVTIRPLSYLPVIKDLVVDRTSFWEQYLRAKPWLIPPDKVPEKEFRVAPDEVAAVHDAEKCILCGACYASCQVVALNKKYMGPHALLKAFLRVVDPRDSMPAERLESVAGDHGVFRCHTIFNCIDACPKKLNPTQAIESLRKLVQKRRAFANERSRRQQRLLQESR